MSTINLLEGSIKMVLITTFSWKQTIYKHNLVLCKEMLKQEKCYQRDSFFKWEHRKAYSVWVYKFISKQCSKEYISCFGGYFI